MEVIKISQQKNNLVKKEDDTTTKPRGDSQARNWLLTLNNPLAPEHGYNHEYIIDVLTNKLKSIIYFNLADEVGIEEKTPHTHVYLVSKSPLRFSTIKKHFPKGRIEKTYGAHSQLISYVEKTGKWKEDEKADTSIAGTFKEYGDRPKDRRNTRDDLADIYEMIVSGASNVEILQKFPGQIRALRDVDYVRQSLREEEFRYTNRDLLTTYIWGPTGVGKTYNLMNNDSLGAIYRVTDYSHPWDAYNGQEVVILDEFYQSLKINELINICDIYPLQLPARYTNKTAMFSKVFIVSNLDLNEQYKNARYNQPRIWEALLRRIQKIVVYTAYQEYREYSTSDYNKNWARLPDNALTPFDVLE